MLLSGLQVDGIKRDREQKKANWKTHIHIKDSEESVHKKRKKGKSRGRIQECKGKNRKVQQGVSAGKQKSSYSFFEKLIQNLYTTFKLVQ